MRMTLKELLWQYEGLMLGQWDQTSLVASGVHNLHALVQSIGGRRQPKYVSGQYFNPYREDPRPRLKITPKNIHVLREFAEALVAGKK